jgi:hypothetical protein
MRRVDEEHGVSDRIRDTGTRLREAGSQIDDKYGVSETSSKVTSAVSTAAENATSTAAHLAEESGLYEVSDRASTLVSEHLAAPAAELAARFGVEERLESIGRAFEDLYGSRSVPKLERPLRSPSVVANHSTEEFTALDRGAAVQAALAPLDQSVPESLMVPLAVVVLDGVADDSPKVAFAERDHLVDAL